MHLPSRAPGRIFTGWNLAACIAWIAAFLGMLIHRLGHHSHDLSSHWPASLDIFLPAGERWFRGELLYTNWRGFVYSPLAAAAFAALAALPARVAVVAWLSLNCAVFLGGFAALLRTTQRWPRERAFHGVAFILLIPLGLGNLDVLQANPLLIGLLMFAVAGVRTERWIFSAFCIGIATYLKIYPLAIGMLLALVAPPRYTVALLLALIVMGLATFLFQHADYVCGQYKMWIVTRAADNRLKYSLKDAPVDLSFLLVWIGGLPISGVAYRLLEALSGGAAAFLVFLGRRQSWSRERLLSGIFCLGAIWMTLFGPATEWFTYILLAPAVVMATVDAFARPRSAWMRAAVSTAFGLLLWAAFQHSFRPQLKGVWSMAVPPVAALVFLGYCIVWLLDGGAWREPTGDGPVDALDATHVGVGRR